MKTILSGDTRLLPLIGPCTVIASPTHICSVVLGIRERQIDCAYGPTILTDRCFDQLQQYFLGKCRLFSLPLCAEGTVFQQKVWDAVSHIPIGQTRTYRQIAETIGNSLAYRAVAQACKRNPIPLLIPCHRVVASHGKIGGYAYGLLLKQQLLDLEQRFYATDVPF